MAESDNHHLEHLKTVALDAVVGYVLQAQPASWDDDTMEEEEKKFIGGIREFFSQLKAQAVVTAEETFYEQIC